ncbi:peptide chain release factor N(5)-glutamine methyltransferase [Lysobacter korlensis]|uniref:Release factor glutamine methyltransferase n=1 Tax=Lysobacter korlensis TaxID=553636 RepID=A0ABV6RJP2_9GAMM
MNLPHPDAAGPRVDQLLADARGRIDAIDAEVLLAHVLDRSRTWLFAYGDAVADPAQAERFAGLVARREAGEPVAYLTGRRGFWRFDLAVTPATLIPRPETELLVELALERIPAGGAPCVADLGTGSGAIALALAYERPGARVIATDASDEALEVARSNAVELGLSNVEFRLGDWCAPIAGATFDVIASNPPYIARDDAHLKQGDLRFEPATALASGDDGLDAIRTIARDALPCVRAGGWLLLEHGFDQGAAVRALLEAQGWRDVATAADLEARDRVTLGRRAM